jgi:GTP cyclohydrolase I
MAFKDNLLRELPDVASDAVPAVAGVLDGVGMDEIALPVLIAGADGQGVPTAARVGVWVNLVRPDARGIHMSRLYLQLGKSLSSEPLTPCSLRRALREFVASHAGLSDRALLRVHFEPLLLRPALVSDNSGWKSYPIILTARLEQGEFSVELACEIAYSSTCPCSAALARRLVQDDFSAQFPAGRALDRDAVLAWLGSEQGMAATPHSQRSSARVRVRLAPGFDLPIVDIVDAVESALQTPVQTAVKREDEQAFARLNGTNLMFCEDAARRIQSALDADERIADYWLRATHHESLHAHDAVAIAIKGVSGGFTA